MTVAPVLAGVVLVVAAAGAVLLLHGTDDLGGIGRIKVAGDTLGAVRLVGINVHIQRLDPGVVQHNVGAAPENDARPLCGEIENDAALRLINKILLVIGNGRDVAQDTLRGGDLLALALDLARVNAARLGGGGNDVAVVERNAKLFPHCETDLASSCAVLPADGDDLHITAASPVFLFIPSIRIKCKGVIHTIFPSFKAKIAYSTPLIVRFSTMRSVGSPHAAMGIARYG